MSHIKHIVNTRESLGKDLAIVTAPTRASTSHEQVTELPQLRRP